MRAFRFTATKTYTGIVLADSEEGACEMVLERINGTTDKHVVIEDVKRSIAPLTEMTPKEAP